MVPHQQQWLLPLAAKLVAGLLDELPVRGERPSVIMAALDMFRWCNERGMYIAHGLAEVKKAVERHPCVRRALFWQRVEEHRQEKGSTPTRYFELRCSYELFELSNADHSWLTVDAKARPNVQERLLAFDVLSKTPVTEATPHAHLELLREVAEESPELTRRLSRMLNPPALPIPPISRKWERQARATMLARERHDASNRAELDRRLEQIRDGSDLGALRFLYDNAGLDHSSGEVIAVELLEEKFGRRIAEAAVAGFRAFWRTYDPPLPHERERRDSTPYGVVLGLAGLSLDFARGLDASTMSVTHARLAARYAASELNALPAWLSDLAAAHPAAVADTLGPAVAADLAHPDDGTQIYDVLAKLPRAPEVVKQVLAPCVAQQLRAVEPPTVEALQYALDVLLSLHMSMAQDLSGLAPERCRRAINAPERMAAWWEAWLSVEPNGALDFLESAIREVSPERAYQIVLKVCHRFYDCSMFHATRPLHVRSQPEALRRLIPLVYQYIKPDDDIVHERMYSPGVRDHAQEVRSHLITWLSEISGREALQSLRALAGDPRLAALRDWLLHLAEQRLVSSAGLARPTVVERLTELCKAHGTNLATHLDELREERPMERIDVGIVTMKEEEYDALLDKFGATTVRRGTNRDYDVVRVETKRGACAVAITRCAQQGNTFAQTAATEMLSDLNPRFLLVVGIAGGVPSPDFCLGDVIVSNYIQDLTLEDTGVRPGNERYNALGGPLHPSASRILERLRAVERCAVSWSSASSIACERPPLGGEYTTDDETWNASIDEALRRLNGRKEPIGTAQKVASSDRLIKAPELLQKWRQVLKAVAAVEMESAGAYLCCQRNDTPFMAIRGISDIVGWRREDAWTLYACHTAAAYTKMLVSEGVFVDERAASG
jgi:nucleoside phosphorylase